MQRPPKKEPPLRKQDLSPAQLRLLVICETVNYGRIRNLSVCDGQPVFDPPPVIQRDHKFGGQNGARPESLLEDFVLKKEHRDLFRDLETIGNGVIVNLEIRAGLPLIMTTEEAAA